MDKPKKYNADTVMHIRLATVTKSKYVHAAKPGKLSSWVLATLNAELQRIEGGE
jgi:hypothetical protein